jgi:protein-disulfide isomerase
MLWQRKLDDVRDELVSKLRKEAKIEYFMTPPVIEKENIPLMDASSWGDAQKAKVIIVEYSDFECPYCSRASAVIDKVIPSYGDKVLRIFRHYPLPMHEHAKEAAQSAECASRQGKFWEAHDILFKNQTKLSAEEISAYMQKIGLNMDSYKACLTSGAADKIIERDIDSGAELKIDGTPTIFVNGMRFEGMPDESMLIAYIEAELHK